LRALIFENKAQRRILGPKRENVIRGWNKLHNEELNNLYSSSNILGRSNQGA
jgi:hypothetical protein